MTPHEPRQFTEQEKRRSRARHRELIVAAYEEAKLCCRHYDEQQTTGEIGEQLYRDLNDAAFGLYMELYGAVRGTDYEKKVDDIGDEFRAVMAADKPAREQEEVTPETFVNMIDTLTEIVEKSDLDSKVER